MNLGSRNLGAGPLPFRLLLEPVNLPRLVADGNEGNRKGDCVERINRPVENIPPTEKYRQENQQWPVTL